MKAGLFLGACLSIPVAGGVAAAEEQAPPEVAVITVGSDAAAAGNLQYILEHGLARVPTVMTLSSGTIVSRMGLGTAFQEPIWPARVKSAELLATVQEHYYRGDLDEATALLKAISELHEQNAPVPATDRINLLLTEAAVLLAKGEEAAAKDRAKIVLTLAPDREVDTNVFRPSFARFMDRLRKDLVMANVVVAGLPPGADIRIDDRPAGTRFTVPVGEHQLSLRAPGFRAVEVPFTATADHRVTARLPIEVAEEDAAKLDELVWETRPHAEHRDAVKRVADTLQVKALVIASVRRNPTTNHREVRSVIWWDTRKGSFRYSSATAGDRAGMGTLAAWTAATLRKGPPAGLGSSTAATGLLWSIDGGLVSGLRSYDMDALESTGGTESQTVAIGHLDLFGAGPRLATSLSWRNLFIEGDVTYVSYRFNAIDVTLPDGADTVRGGDSLEVRAAFGYRYKIRLGGGHEPLRMKGTVGAYSERHFADTPADRYGAVGFLPSYRAGGMRMRLGGAWSATPQIEIGGEFAFRPLNNYEESPKGLSGASPDIADYGWVFQARYHRSNGWALGLLYEGRTRRIDFQGDLSAPTTPTYFDATLRETWHTLTVSLRRSF